MSSIRKWEYNDFMKRRSMNTNEKRTPPKKTTTTTIPSPVSLPSNPFTVRHFIICFRARIPILSTSNYNVYFCMSFTKITETKYLVQYNSGIPIIITAWKHFIFFKSFSHFLLSLSKVLLFECKNTILMKDWFEFTSTEYLSNTSLVCLVCQSLPLQTWRGLWMSVWLVCPCSLLPRPSSPWVRPVTLLHPYPRVLRKSTSRKARFTDYLTIRLQNQPIKPCSNINYSLNVLKR